MEPRIHDAIEDFWQARKSGVYFPPEWFDRLTLEEGYLVQLGLLDKLIANGSKHVGWKVGLTAEPMQRQFGVHEPVFGFLLSDGVQQSPAVVTFDELIGPGLENELCVTIGTEVSGRGLDERAARAAVLSVQPAMELVETRGPFSEQLAVAIGENVQQKGVIVSKDSHPLGPELDLAAVSVEIQLNGEVVDQARGEAVLGNPIRSVVWLADKLSQFGRRLEAGQLVMTGSLTRQYRMNRGDSMRAAWRPFGPIEVEFT